MVTKVYTRLREIAPVARSDITQPRTDVFDHLCICSTFPVDFQNIDPILFFCITSFGKHLEIVEVETLISDVIMKFTQSALFPL